MTYEDLDERLVNELIDSGRTSLRQLSDEIGVSVTTVSNHLSSLEEDGSVEGFSPIINYEGFGYDVTGVMQLKVDGQRLPEFVDELTEHENFLSVYEITGDYDVIAIGKFEDTDDMNEQVKTLLQDDAVVESNTSVALNAVQENDQFELPVEE